MTEQWICTILRNFVEEHKDKLIEEHGLLDVEKIQEYLKVKARG